MSYKATHWAYDMSITGPAKPVLVALADMADESASCFPGQERLAAMTGLSIPTVGRALARLERLGLLSRERRFGKFGYRTSDRYHLNLTVTVPESLPITAPTRQRAYLAESQSLPIREPIPTYQSDRAIEPPVEPPVEPSDSSSDAKAPDVGFSEDVLDLCDLLATMIKANGHLVGTVGVTWWWACERLMRLDHYTATQIEWVMRWACETSEFWQANIRSMPTLRKQFSILKVQAMADVRKAQPKPTAVDRNVALAQQYRNGEIA